MPNLVGIGNSQVPTNAMLGGLAYQDPAHANLTEVEIENIAAIKAKIDKTAAGYGIFVYDTRKDSDGGAWRKRCQNTSWFNEDLGGKQRGHRREFPAVAILVSLSSGLFIYDADDPNCSLWMWFQYGTSGSLAGQKLFYSNGYSCYALNGYIAVGGTASWKDGLVLIDFISDNATWRNDAYWAQWNYGIGQRNTAKGYVTFFDNDSTELRASYVYSIAMKVLPGAPYNKSRGILQPTIACGLNNGATVLTPIHDESGPNSGSGTRGYRTVDYYSSAASNYQTRYLSFTNENRLVMPIGDASRYIYVLAPPVGCDHVAINGNLNSAGEEAEFYCFNSGSSCDMQIGTYNGGGDGARAFCNTEDEHVFGFQNNIYDGALIKVAYDMDTPSNGMQVSIGASFCSGYMGPNPKLCLLASTDSTDSSSTNLSLTPIPTVLGGTGNWSQTGSDWSDNGNGTLTCNGSSNPGTIYIQRGGWEGTRKTIELTVDAYTSGSINFSYHTGHANSDTITINSTGTYTYQAQNGVSGNSVIYVRGVNFVGTISNIKIYSEEDRSYNRKGLSVYGTVTKTAVADGSSLMGYSGWSSSNFMKQEYNSQLSFSGDYSVVCWFKVSDASATGFIFDRSRTDGGDRYAVYMESGSLKHYSHDGSTSEHSTSLTDYDDEWVHMVATNSKDGWKEFYLNGVRVSRTQYTRRDLTNTNANAILSVGVRYSLSSSTNPWPGSLALLRINGAIPDANQIRKMYNEESPLFRPNAQTGLSGASESVQGVDFDDSTGIVHVISSTGRTDLSGLVTINTTDTSTTTKISASGGVIAEQ